MLNIRLRSRNLVTLMNIETSVFKNCPQVLASCTVRNVADENLGRLPEKNMINDHTDDNIKLFIIIRKHQHSAPALLQFSVRHIADGNLGGFSSKEYHPIPH